MLRYKKAPKLCCVCKTAPLFQYGRCSVCFRAMDAALFERLKKMTRKERSAEFEKLAKQPAARPKFEWAGQEDLLAAQFGQNKDSQLASPKGD
jgi:hypothetical protein